MINKYIGFVLITLFSCTANAGVLDRFKDNSSLLMNNSNCYFGNGKQIEISNGNVIVNGVVVVGYVSKIDKDRVSFDFAGDGNPFILNLKRKDKMIEATVPNGKILITCKL